MDEIVSRLLSRADVAAARRWLEEHDADTLAFQRELAGIPAPSGEEAARASRVAAAFKDIGLDGVGTDGVGNVHGRLGDGGGPGVVLAAHLDTVFPAATAITVKANGSRVTAPGISDNARGLAAMVAVARALKAAGVRHGKPITFVGTVGEEGAGDLKGVKHLFTNPAFTPLAFVALDGAGIDRVVHRAVGSRRLRATFRGPGGHSWAAFGVANAAHAAAIAAADIAAIQLRASPRTSASVVRLGGGSALNTIPTEAWIELDLRSEEESALESVYGTVKHALRKALDLVNRRRTAGTPPLVLEVAQLGNRPCGVTDARHPLVQAALAATRAIACKADLAAASTDANVPISRGVPGIALGAGGKGGDTHRETEWYENEGGPDGIFRALLVALSAAEAAR